MVAHLFNVKNLRPNQKRSKREKWKGFHTNSLTLPGALIAIFSTLLSTEKGIYHLNAIIESNLRMLTSSERPADIKDVTHVKLFNQTKLLEVLLL